MDERQIKFVLQIISYYNLFVLQNKEKEGPVLYSPFLNTQPILKAINRQNKKNSTIEGMILH